MTKKTVEVGLNKEIVIVMSELNSRHGVVGHEFSEVEKGLSDRNVSYDNYDLERALTELIGDERIVIHVHKEDAGHTRYGVLLRSLV